MSDAEHIQVPGGCAINTPEKYIFLCVGHCSGWHTKDNKGASKAPFLSNEAEMGLNLSEDRQTWQGGIQTVP